jgi:hypothetical protein
MDCDMVDTGRTGKPGKAWTKVKMKIGTVRTMSCWYPVAVACCGFNSVSEAQIRARDSDAELDTPRENAMGGYIKGVVGKENVLPDSPEMATSTLPRTTLPAPQHCIDVLLPQQQLHTSLNAILKRPIPNSYWATPLLLACEYPWCPGVAEQKIEALLAAGVRTFIDLTEVDELRAYSSYLAARTKAMGLTDVEYHRFPIVDRSLPESVEYMRDILQVLKDNEKRDRITAVHCRGGIGRTGEFARLSETDDLF